jgi:hypothetical protein
MVTWWQSSVGVLRRDFGAGVVAATVALFASLVSLLALQFYPQELSADAQYWFGYAPQFAALAGLVVGAVAWRRVTSRASTPGRGALAGIVIL